MSGQGRGFEMPSLVVQCAGSEWSRSSVMTGHLPAQGVYKRAWPIPKIYVILIIIIIVSISFSKAFLHGPASLFL